ncbi:hypothetical protein HY483_02520 [Candidatus Woesearchaeota archaeon]|nr:hypothetical protein [Candidatus Woesearchaeota archaeon]
MIEPINAVVGGGVIILNSIPFILRKPKLLLLTSIVSFLFILLLITVK